MPTTKKKGHSAADGNDEVSQTIQFVCSCPYVALGHQRSARRHEAEPIPHRRQAGRSQQQPGRMTPRPRGPPALGSLYSRGPPRGEVWAAQPHTESFSGPGAQGKSPHAPDRTAAISMDPRFSSCPQITYVLWLLHCQ